jgi:hypothetical protein
VTNAIGQQVARSVTIETFDPTPDAPAAGAEKGTAGSAEGAAGEAGAAPSLDTPQPTDGRTLSPSEMPPQFN